MSLPTVPGLEFSSDGPVIEATLRRGDENLMSMDMCVTLTRLLDDPPADARILHLRAAGPVFCLGRDRGFGDRSSIEGESEILVELNRALTESRLVSVTEVAGDAAGFGVGLAALSDVSIASPSARFWFPEVAVGIAPTVVLTWLPSVVGRSHAFRLTATGERVDGREAARLGLVTGVSESPAALGPLVQEQITTLLSVEQRPQREIKSFMVETVGMHPSAVRQTAVQKLVANTMRLGVTD